MGILIYSKKNRGFLFIATTILSIVLLFNLLIGYRIIMRKSEKIEQLERKREIDELKFNLETLAYSELKRINSEIKVKNYLNGAQYIGKNLEVERVWYGDTTTRRSETGYELIGMILNNKRKFYTYKKDEKVIFRDLIRRELIVIGKQLNIVGVELEKIIRNEETGEKIYFKARVDLYYQYGNNNPLAPYKEVLKDFEVGVKY